ncbi:Lrp/AsnC family transcriptional regulator, partial [Ilumatobacter sp.]|uniref:Lrp/AsnC family transcriptional regulator n=1 Tax=Ilumatobacter sp. TaxID=1967498 RepID=UPI003AF4CDE3
MDDIDRAILDHLQRDGRIANNELADRVGLSPSPCLRRVRALEAAGVIRGYAARLDESAVACDYQPLVWVTLQSVTRESMLDFEAAVSSIAEITEVDRMMGQPDYLLRVVTIDA